MNAIVELYRSPYYGRARAYCDQHDLGSEHMEGVIFSMGHKEFIEMSEPLRNLKASYVGLYPRNVYVRAGSGELEPWVMPADLVRALELLDEQIDLMAEKCGLKMRKEPPPEGRG